MTDLTQVQAVEPEPGLARSAYDEIRRAIISGALPEGSLTSARVLSEALGISRTPVREALVELAGDGMVSFERNRGVRICVTRRQDVEEIFDLRLLLEVPAVKRAVGALSDSVVAALEEAVAQMQACLDDEAEFMRHDWAFHRVLLEKAGNERLVAIVGRLRDQTRTQGISTVGRSRQLDAIVAEHQCVLEAVRRRDAAAAAAEMEDHLKTTRDLLLAQEDAVEKPDENQEER